jgi:hypothetical protein
LYHAFVSEMVLDTDWSEVGSLRLGGAVTAAEVAILCPGVVGFWPDRHQRILNKGRMT